MTLSITPRVSFVQIINLIPKPLFHLSCYIQVSFGLKILPLPLNAEITNVWRIQLIPLFSLQFDQLCFSLCPLAKSYRSHCLLIDSPKQNLQAAHNVFS